MANPHGGPKPPQQPWGGRDSSRTKPELCCREPLAGIASPFVTQHKGIQQRNSPCIARSSVTIPCLCWVNSNNLRGCPPASCVPGWQLVGRRSGLCAPGSPPWLRDGLSWLKVLVASALPVCSWHCPRDPRACPTLRGHLLAKAGQRMGKLITQLLSLLLRAALLQTTGRFSAGKNTEFSLFLRTMNQFSCPWSFSTFKLRTQETLLVCTTFLFSVNFFSI